MATIEQYPGWDKVAYIHDLQLDQNIIEAVLCVAEYGYIPFFANYPVFLASRYRQTIADMFFEEIMEWFISPYYSQLWRGLDHQPIGYLEERKNKKALKYEYFDSLVNTEPIARPKGTGKLSELLKQNSHATQSKKAQ